MKTLYLGDEGSGKSLAMSEQLFTAISTAEKYKKQGYQPMEIATTYLPDNGLVQLMKTKGIPWKYIEDYDDLEDLKGGFLFIDEAEVFLDARNYANLPLHVRKFFSQADKNGIEIFATAQNFAQIDISFRRLLTHIYLCRKIAGSRRPHPTRPSKKNPWGIFVLKNYEKVLEEGLTEPVLKPVGLLSFSVEFYGRKRFMKNNTNQGVKVTDVKTMRHVTKHCKTCGKIHVTHT